MTHTELSSASPWLATDSSVYTKGISWPEVAAVSLQELIHLHFKQAARALKLLLQRGIMARQIYTMNLAVPPLSLTPQAPSLHLCRPMLIPPCSELLWRERPGGNWLQTKPNSQINSLLLVHTAESDHCRTSQGRMDIPRPGTARST